MILARRVKQRSLKYRVETTLTRWAADITHSFLIWRKTKRIPANFIKESAIAFSLASVVGVAITLIGVALRS
jgi:hypothetical protein